MVQERDPLAKGLRFLKVVRRENDGVALRVEFAHEVPEAVPQLHVHARRRLVQDDDRGLVHERLADQDSPLHAARKSRHFFVRLVRQAELFQQFVNPRVIFQEAVVPALLAQDLPHGEEGIEGDFLRHDADRGLRQARLGEDVVPEHRDRARVRHDDAGEDADQGAFPSAVGAQQAEDLAFGDVKGNVGERVRDVLRATVGLRETRDSKSRRHGGSQNLSMAACAA